MLLLWWPQQWEWRRSAPSTGRTPGDTQWCTLNGRDTAAAWQMINTVARQSNSPYQASQCFDKETAAMWTQWLSTRSQIGAPQGCDRGLLQQREKHGNWKCFLVCLFFQVMYSSSIAFKVSLWYLNHIVQTSWYPLEHFGQCVASCDVVANHGWGGKGKTFY